MSKPPGWRSGHYAIVAGRDVPVRQVDFRRDDWREVLDPQTGRTSDQVLHRTDLVDLVSVRNTARLEGLRVDLEDITDGIARISSIHGDVSDAMYRHSEDARGNRYDGWVAHVPLEVLTDLTEHVRHVPA